MIACKLGTWRIDFRVRFFKRNIEPFSTTGDKVLFAILIFKFLEHGVYNEKSWNWLDIWSETPESIIQSV